MFTLRVNYDILIGLYEKYARLSQIISGDFR